MTGVQTPAGGWMVVCPEPWEAEAEAVRLAAGVTARLEGLRWVRVRPYRVVPSKATRTWTRFLEGVVVSLTTRQPECSVTLHVSLRDSIARLGFRW